MALISQIFGWILGPSAAFDANLDMAGELYTVNANDQMGKQFVSGSIANAERPSAKQISEAAPKNMPDNTPWFQKGKADTTSDLQTIQPRVPLEYPYSI